MSAVVFFPLAYLLHILGGPPAFIIGALVLGSIALVLATVRLVLASRLPRLTAEEMRLLVDRYSEQLHPNEVQVLESRAVPRLP